MRARLPLRCHFTRFNLQSLLFVRFPASTPSLSHRFAHPKQEILQRLITMSTAQQKARASLRNQVFIDGEWHSAPSQFDVSAT
jgi:hypothetical protein